jgi:hypothetical protein
MTMLRPQHDRPIAGWWLVVAVFIWLTVPGFPGTDIEIPLLRSGTDVFTNVTVYGKSETDIFIRHSRGMGNVKIARLDDPTLIALGIKSAPSATAAAPADGDGNSTAVQKVKASFAAANFKLPSEAAMLGAISRFQPTPDKLMMALAIATIAYRFSCYCLKQICVKAGTKPGVLVWFPVLQMFPLLRAARMPAWWFIMFLIPVLNLLAHILWCVRIAQACGKGNLVTVLLILPGTNVLALLYLAFSSGNEESAEKGVKFEGRSAGYAEA